MRGFKPRAGRRRHAGWAARIGRPRRSFRVSSRVAAVAKGMRALDKLIHVFLEVLLLRKGPQDLPTAPFLLYLTLALHALSGVALALAYQPPFAALALGATDTALLALLTGSLLYIQRRQMRLVQTLSALAGTGFVLALAALAPTWWLAHAHAAGSEAGLPAFALLGLVLWSLVVTGHVLRHALSAPLIVGVLIAIVFYWVALNVQDALFPLAD